MHKFKSGHIVVVANSRSRPGRFWTCAFGWKKTENMFQTYIVVDVVKKYCFFYPVRAELSWKHLTAITRQFTWFDKNLYYTNTFIKVVSTSFGQTSAISILDLWTYNMFGIPYAWIFNNVWLEMYVHEFALGPKLIEVKVETDNCYGRRARRDKGFWTCAPGLKFICAYMHVWERV